MTRLLIAALIAPLLLGLDGPDGETSARPRVSLPVAPASTTSVGHPYYGKLRDGIRLDAEGPFHRVQDSTVRRDWVYGTGYLVRGLLVSAEAIGRLAPGGQPLVIGNLSRKGGGDIHMSMSHNSGRDVDLAYYASDRDGKPVESKYHRFGPSGRSRSQPGLYRLDLGSNWTAIKTLIVNPEFELQWVIVAPWIEDLLIAHARTLREPEDLIRRAQRLMMQPPWAKPHDNHIHIRVLCSPEDWKRGCQNAGPVWPWNTRMLSALDDARRRISPGLESRQGAVRAATLAELRKREVTTAAVDVAPLLSDPDPAVRKSALETLVALSTEANATTVLKIARWSEARQAATLIETALPLAGIDGLTTARELIDARHPVLDGELPRSVRDSLTKTARRLLERYSEPTSAPAS